jgi:hypothetical protein
LREFLLALATAESCSMIIESMQLRLSAPNLDTL